MESKLVEYARAVVEDAVDVDADFFQKFRDAMSFRAIMQSQHPYIIGVAISDILKKTVFFRDDQLFFLILMILLNQFLLQVSCVVTHSMLFQK